MWCLWHHHPKRAQWEIQRRIIQVAIIYEIENPTTCFTRTGCSAANPIQNQLIKIEPIQIDLIQFE